MKDKVTTRDRIMEAAEAVFAERGYHDAPVDEIVRRTDMSKGGVYFHFPSKERLFFAVLDHLVDRLEIRINERVAQEHSVIDKLEASLAAALENFSQQRTLARIILAQGYSMGNSFEKKRMEIFSRFASLIRENLDVAVSEGFVIPINTDIVSYVWMGAINEVVIRWLYEESSAPMEEVIPVLSRLLIDGIRVDTEVGVGG